MCRNTKPFNGNYHALPGTADSLREALLTCFILANKRQRQTKADAQELNCQRSQQAVAYSTFGPFTSPRHLLVTLSIFLALTSTWRSVCHSWNISPCRYISCPVPFHPSNISSHQLTNCEVPRCCLCLLSNLISLTTSSIFVTVACCFRIIGNNEGIRGEPWCGLSLCRYC